jgi:16S rRNA (guanine527-N7)-methyltransferase
MSELFQRRLSKGLAHLAIPVAPEGMARLQGYWQELHKWSKKVNLVARDTGMEQLVDGHFLDSLSLLPLLASGKDALLDIGSGAGFPGLACGAARPDLAVTLVEPRRKRAVFLRHVTRMCRMTNIEVLECRVEDEQILPSTRCFKAITSRAVANIGDMLQMVERFHKTCPQLIFMKGPRWEEEMAEAEEPLRCSSFSLHTVKEYTLPGSGAKRFLLVFMTDKLVKTQRCTQDG